MRIPRLYTKEKLHPGGFVFLPDEQAHYIRNVLRLTAGSYVHFFNGYDGEWRACLAGHSRKNVLAHLEEQIRPQKQECDLRLVFAPLKRHPMDFVIEKATELGVSHIYPVLTARTEVKQVRTRRARLIAQEAAEQCERLTVPHIHDAQTFETLLNSWPEERVLLFCDEGAATHRQDTGKEECPKDALSVLQAMKEKSLPVQKDESVSFSLPPQPAVLIGPEGGFEAWERHALLEKPFVSPLSLGPRILRAETAACAILTLWQAVLGGGCDA